MRSLVREVAVAVEVFDEKRLERSLRKLPAWKQVAFMALLGARMLPNYRRFSAETGFGDVSVLEAAFDAAWTWIGSGQSPANLTALLKRISIECPPLLVDSRCHLAHQRQDGSHNCARSG